MSLLTSLISYWKLDEASGTRADAYSANSLTDNNTVTQATGKIGNAAHFTSANTEYLSRASNSSLQTGDIDFTVGGWFKSGTNDAHQGIIGKGTEYNLFVHFVTSGRARFDIGSLNALFSTETVNDGAWHYIIAWHDAANNIAGIQVDGGTPVTASYSSGTTAGSSDFRLSTGTPGNVNGDLDEWGFWKRVLTSGERTSLYNGGAGLAFDATAPTVTAASINAAGTTLSLTYSESVSGVSAADYALSGGATLSGATGSGTSWSMTIAPAVQAGQTRTLSYTGTATIDTSGWGNALATFSGAAVTNGSQVVASSSRRICLGLGVGL